MTDTHVSVFTYLTRGEYDDELEWRSITIDLLNQKEDKNHCSETFDFNRYTDEDGTITFRVLNEEEHGVGCGNSDLISHIDLSYNPTANTHRVPAG